MPSHRQFAFSNLANLISYSATFGLAFILSLFLQTAMKMDAAAAGLVLLIQPVMMALLSPLSGALSDKVEPAILSSLGMGISTLGLIFFIFLNPSTPIPLIMLNLAFVGTGFALFSSPNTNAIMSSVDLSLYGVASAVMSNMRMLGQSLSMAMVSLITSAIIKDIPISSAGYTDVLVSSIKVSFTVFAILCTLGTFASIARVKTVRE